MNDICRLCCSPSFVNNNIFDEENALYLKMSLYLPIKVFKNDRLPQKVCDKCSCKVNDFYQFCNETIEVQERLRAILITSGAASEDIVDLTRIKENVSPVPSIHSCYKLDQSTQTESLTQPHPHVNNIQPCVASTNIQIKEEPRSDTSPLKEESVDSVDFNGGLSGDSDDMSLITLKKKKKSKKEVNGVKKRAPRKKKLKDWTIINGLPDVTSLSDVNEAIKADVKQEIEQKPDLDVTVDVKVVKSEPGEEVFHCCTCFLQCYSKGEILHHYRSHLPAGGAQAAPPAPPAPDIDPARCTRCRKSLAHGEWAAHWARHWERDRRPYRCALCEKSFRDAHQILKHGLTHKYGSGEENTEPVKKRFVCDLCPEGFVYMRYLLAHRSQAHPDALARALVLRCSVCGRQFAHLNSLRRHLRAHSGERNHLCNVCGKALSSREHLKFHIRIHTGYKPNICKTCGKGFVKKCNLTLHERVHSGEKPHVCSACGKAFSQRSTLVIHERYHTGHRPYACALCGRGFVAKGLLSMHLKSTCICISREMSAVEGARVNGHSHTGDADGAVNGGVAADGVTEVSWEEQFLPLPLRIDDRIRAQKIEARLSSLVLCGNTLRRVGRVFDAEVTRGLRGEPSSLQMENTYVPELPDGTEEGVFLALDLGGTNFRVLLLELKAGQLLREDVKHYHISDELRVGPGEDLFNFLADCVLDFLKSEGMENEEFSLGFTFSFPMKQHSISSGELITWTKSFKCGGLGGVDVAALLQRCLRARRLRVAVRVLLNDTTGTLVAGAMTQPHVGIGVILGTGSNGCYMERAARVAHWEAAHERVRDVCVDVEWGAFGDNGAIDFIKTDIDREVDANSLLVRSFTFEKCIGGKYLGAVLGEALAALAREGLFPAAPAHHALETKDLSLFEEENCAGGTAQTLEVLARVCRGAGAGACAGAGVELSTEDALVAQHVAQVVSNRAAQLVSVCIASLLVRMARAQVGVAVDGSVYKRHPRIAARMRKYIALLAPDCPFSLLPAEDGSGKGSALTAAIAARIAARDASH